jgi:hypothetical protein
MFPHTSTDAVYADNAFARIEIGYSDHNPTVGQSFTTGANPLGYSCTGFAIATGNDNGGTDSTAWTIGLFELNGTNIFRQVYTETFTTVGGLGDSSIAMTFTPPVTQQNISGAENADFMWLMDLTARKLN